MIRKENENKRMKNLQDELIRKCRQGDVRAQFSLYKQYSRAMYNVAVRITGNKYDAEDVLQEAFISAFSRMDSFRGDASPGAWIKRIVINQAISFLRSKSADQMELKEEITSEDGPEETVDAALDPSLVHEAIKDLPDGARTILTLYALEGYQHDEIAQILDISISTSKSQYRRGKQLLADKLKNKVYADQA